MHNTFSIMDAMPDMPAQNRPLSRSRLRPLLIVIALVITFVIALLLYLQWSARQDAVRKAEVAALNYSRVLQVRLDASLQRIEALMRISAKQFPPESLVPGAEIALGTGKNAMLDDQLTGFPEFAGIRVLDANGDLRYASGEWNKKNVNSADREFFVEPRDNPKPHLFFSQVIISRLTGKEAMVVSQALRDANGKFYGLMSGGLALDQIQQQFRQLNVGQNGSVFLRRLDNHALVTRWPHNPVLVNQTLSASHPTVLQLANGNSEFTLVARAQSDKIERIVGFKQLERYPFYVGVALNLDETLADWRRQAWLLGLCALGFLLLLGNLMHRLVRAHDNEIDALTNLAQNQARVRLLAKVFEYSGEAILLLNRNQEILEVNAAYSRLTGYSIDEVRQQYWKQQFADLPLPGARATLSQQALPAAADSADAAGTAAGRPPGAGAGQLGVWQGELLCMRKNGSQFTCFHTSSSIVDAGGKVEYLIVSFTDISDRKRMEQLKSEFVSTVSHELRTPLTSIGGALGLILGGVLGEAPAKQKELLNIAHQNTLRLSILINDLLDMEKLVAGKMLLTLETRPLMPLVDAAIETNQAYAMQRQVQLRIVRRDDHAQVLVDPNRLQQVLSNLLSNAAKFSPPNSLVEVALQCVQGRIRVEVIDHGSGVPEAFHSRIFQKFAQADSADTRKQGGTGLGLAISKELIEQMGGQVGFSRTTGGGATFYFELPLVQQGNGLRTQ